MLKRGVTTNPYQYDFKHIILLSNPVKKIRSSNVPYKIPTFKNMFLTSVMKVVQKRICTAITVFICIAMCIYVYHRANYLSCIINVGVSL